MSSTKDISLENASTYPNFYYAKHLASGLAGYEEETILIDNDALKEMMPSFVGKPIVVLHQDIELQNLHEKDGTVIESFYNELDACAWVKMIIETDKARSAIAQGWSVSNCYQPTQWEGSGNHHNVSYNRKILNGTFKHLAIVPNPRYEEAKIYTPEEFNLYQKEKKDKLTTLQNAKEEKKMLKLFKNKKEEVTQIDEDTILTLDNGKEVYIKDMINALAEAEKNNSKMKINMEQKVPVGESEMTLTELVSKYNAMMKKCNKEDKDEDDKDKDKENEEDEEEDKKSKDKEKTNKSKKNTINEDEIANAINGIKHFNDLINASNRSTIQNPDNIESVAMKVDRGKKQYGSAK